MLALSIRQPFAELILRGIKTVEYRSRATRVVGQRFWIYASCHKTNTRSREIWSRDLSTMDDPPGWMLELAEQIKLIPPDAILPRGVIVGSAVIEKVSQADSMFGWHLSDVERAKDLRQPHKQPQPTWFNPF